MTHRRRATAALGLTLAIAACSNAAPLVLLIPSEVERYWLLDLAPGGAIQVLGPSSAGGLNGEVLDGHRLLLVGLRPRALDDVHPRAQKDLQRAELVVDSAISSCELRFEGQDSVEVVASKLASLEEIDLEGGRLGPPGAAWTAELARLRLRVALETEGCPKADGPGRLVADLSNHPNVSTSDGLETHWTTYVDEDHYALLSQLHVFIVGADAPTEPRLDWPVLERAPAGLRGGRAAHGYASLSGPPEATRVLALMGNFAGTEVLGDTALVELRLAPDDVTATLRREVPDITDRLAARPDGAWASLGTRRVITSTSADEGAPLHILELGWQPRLVALAPPGPSELLVASGNRVLSSRLAPPTREGTFEFSGLDENRTLALGGTRDGSAVYFSSRSSMFRQVGEGWNASSLALDSGGPCPVLDRDECGRLVPNNGMAEILPGPGDTLLMLVNECPGVVIYDPHLDCGIVPALAGGSGVLALNGAAVLRDRVLLVEKHGQAFELRVSVGP